MKEKLRVVTYMRVASNNYDSIFNKELVLSDLVKSHQDEWNIVDRVFDYGISGRKYERPGLLHLIEMCKKGEVDLVVTLNSYMLARDVLVYKRIYQELAEAEVELYIDELHKSKYKDKKNFKVDVSKFQNKISQLIFA